MKNVTIDDSVKDLLELDPITNAEKLLKKNVSDFTEEENLSLLKYAFAVNKQKESILKSLNDTTFSMKWDYFIELIESQGFKLGHSYNFDYKDEWSKKVKKEKACIYYHPIKGLVIWVTSYNNGTTVNGGTLYGQLKFTKHDIEYKTETTLLGNEYRDLVITDELTNAFKSLNGCSHCALIDVETGVSFSRDIRDGLFNHLHRIEKHFDYATPWVRDQFIWFVDYTETKQPVYDHKQITQNKIKRSSQELQDILSVLLK